MDDAEFEAYIGRRSRLSRRYQDLSTEIPPKELDEAVLARARAAHAFERKETPEREIYIGWMAPVAFAATVVLVFTVVLQIVIRPQIVMRQEPADEARTSAAAAAPPAEPREAKTESDARFAEKLAADAQPARRLTDDVPPAAAANADRPKLATAAPQAARTDKLAEAPAQSVAASSPDLQKKDRNAESGSLQSVVTTGNRVTAASSERAAASTGDLEAMRHDPKAWLAYIKELRANGDTASADRQMKLFLEKYPEYFHDHPLPDDAR
ncbi:MAG TPA: hypothetical protein VE046_13365 [Steroidobacteraceae bacterium]|nr:hypothetical protein [Steroidobacteraceae bacterium]